MFEKQEKQGEIVSRVLQFCISLKPTLNTTRMNTPPRNLYVNVKWLASGENVHSEPSRLVTVRNLRVTWCSSTRTALPQSRKSGDGIVMHWDISSRPLSWHFTVHFFILPSALFHSSFCTFSLLALHILATCSSHSCYLLFTLHSSLLTRHHVSATIPSFGDAHRGGLLARPHK